MIDAGKYMQQMCTGKNLASAVRVKKKFLQTQPVNLFFFYLTSTATDKHAKALCK
jgi:hypothetical protein